MKVRLGDVGKIITGSTPKTSDSNNYDSNDIPFIKPSDISDDEICSITKSEYYISEKAREKARILPPGCILISCIGIVGKVGINKTECSFNQQINAIIPSEHLCDTKYVSYAIKFLEPQLQAKANAAVVPILNKSQFSDIQIALPSLEEQRHIAAVLDKVSELISKRKAQLDKLDELVKSRFVEMFGDPVSNPKQWSTLSLRDAGSRLSDGPFGSNLKSEHYTTEGVRVIRLGNIGVGKFIDNDKSYISKQHYEKLKKYTCKAGEIVIATLGEPNLRACLVPQRIECAVNKADCVHYIPKKELLNTRFVCQYINCPETLLLASEMVHGQTRSRISSGQLAEMKIFVPPKELQEQFAAFVEKTEKTKATISHSLDQLETLKKALMQKYFG